MRKKSYYIVFLLLCVVTGCGETERPEVVEEKNVTIRLGPSRSGWTRLIDDDNLAMEETIINLSVFFTEPSSTAIVYKYVFTGFSISGEEQVITLPLEATDLQTKDVYVIANYDDESELDDITTLDGIRALFTPEIGKSNNLDPSEGFCMFGHTYDVDFTDSSNFPVYVELVRSCAKFRINLNFPEDPTLSTNNTFLIQKAAKYTHVVENLVEVLPTTDYFNFAAPLPLNDNGRQSYTNIAYVYESSQAPLLTIYTHINGEMEEQEFTATLPLPQRNYLYDLFIRVYEEEDASTRAITNGEKKTYTIESTTCVYNAEGQQIEELKETGYLQRP